MVGCVVNSIVTYTKQIKFHDYSTWLGDKLNLIFVTDKLFMIHDILSVSFISMVIHYTENLSSLPLNRCLSLLALLWINNNAYIMRIAVTKIASSLLFFVSNFIIGQFEISCCPM